MSTFKVSNIIQSSMAANNIKSEKLMVLYVVLNVGTTSAPYNEYALPMADRYDVTICTYFKPDIQLSDKITLFEGNGSLLGFFKTLKNALNAKKYDIIHTHTPHVGLLLLIAAIFTHRKIMIHTVHSSYPRYEFKHKLMLIPVFFFFRKIVCCSESSLASFPQFFRRLSRNRIGVVQNGVDIRRVDRILADVAKQSTRDHSFTILTIGRLISIKNPLSLLDAFQQVMGLKNKLVFIGEGPLMMSLIAETKNLGLEEKVEITGLLPREVVYERLAKAHLYISASQIEGMPVAVLEAMACRCPVILSDIPSHREIANGIDFIPLVHPNDVTGFAREIRRFQAMSPDERENIGEKCRELVEERFSLTSMQRGYDRLYSEIVTGK